MNIPAGTAASACETSYLNLNGYWEYSINEKKSRSIMTAKFWCLLAESPLSEL